MDISEYLDKHEKKDLLRFLTCGSVDDGKSTLIGRLLYDSKLIYDDQLSKLKSDSEKSGNKGDEDIDYSLLLDGLKAEREQGITIDVAYRYFSTPKRKFIIADTPGHEQYTRNMATGASTADCAVILIDARHGVITQTKRHSFIVSLLGIKHVVVAVNKMDLVDYSQEVFENIRDEFDVFSEQLDICNKYYIPLSALKGDNVVNLSEKTSWYNEKSLIELLETIDISEKVALDNFRFSVQYVNRPNLDFRGFSGRVASGVVSVGDSITILPSGKRSHVKRIVTADGDLKQAVSPLGVTLVIDDEIDISSGDMIVHSDSIPKVSSSFEVITVWMSEDELKTGDTLLMRHFGRNYKVRVDSIEYSIDVNTMEKKQVAKLSLNGIGKLLVSSTSPIAFDPYTVNRETGSFIFIDSLTNNTAGASMIVSAVSEDRAKEIALGSDLKKHVERREFYWKSGVVTPAHRASVYHHKGKTVLLTGSDEFAIHKLASSLEKELFDMYFKTYYLGIGNSSTGLNSDISAGFMGRDEHIRRVGELARIMTDAGLIFISAFDNATIYDLETLAELNYPNDLIIVSVGDAVESELVSLVISDKTKNPVKEILNILSDRRIIPDYCI